jgi:hypothetical protein
VSPLWRDEVGVFLGPRRLVLNRLRRGLRPRCVSRWSAALEQPDLTDWSVALAALDAELAKSEWQQANLRVVISDQWARYGIVPWAAELRDEAERQSHARFVLANTYGDIVEHWTLGVSEHFPGCARIVSALPTRLLEELRARVGAHGLRLTSTQPHLVVAYNAWRHRLVGPAGWFVTIEEGSLAALHWSDGSWDRVHSVRISDNWEAELRRVQAFGRLTRARPAEGRVFIDAPAGLRTATSGTDPGLEWLDDEQSAPAVPFTPRPGAYA